MTNWWLLVVGATAAGPLGALLALWLTRRTRRRKIEAAAKAKAHDHLAELARLAGGLAHEIKNPLSTINVNLRLLSEDLARRDDDEHRRWLRRLRTVRNESDRLKTILDDFLRYAGKYELSMRPADLRRIVGELVDFFAPQADDARVVLRSALPEGRVPCHLDEDLLKQALINLMINAVQAMDGGGELLVQVAARDAQATVEVIDTGCGIPPDRLERIFDVYYSTKKGGTGLGLATTRRIIREHGGTIRLESEPGKGTRFVISLPLVEPPSDSEPA
jgi:two-component system sensor histidine kinase HydH